ncbi:MAG: response regulator, partial [Alphaproteobacteria bacterium]
GIGMSADQVANLFQPFTQAEGSIRRRFGGTGLGLAICSNLTGMMGGTIEAASESGQGSTFTVLLPLRVPADNKPQARESDLSGLTVLVLVDDVELRWIVRRYLEYWRATVEPVDSVDRLRDRHAAMGSERGGTVLVVVQADRHAQLGLDGVIGLAAEPELAASRFIALTDMRGAPRLDIPSIVLVGINPLLRSRLIEGVAIAAGRASPEVRVTAETVAPAAQRRAPSIEEAAARGELILVAEDNATNQDVIRRQLNRLGYAAYIVGDGQEALAALDSGRYAMLLTDCHMPIMDGYALTEAIRAREASGGARLPVIAITANALQGEAERCLAAGMDGYLAKPIEMARLREMLQRWMPAASDTDSAEPPASSPPSTDAAAVLDPNALREMFGDDEQTIREILKEFPEPSEAIVAELLQAHAARDADGIAAAAHKLKSSARAIGASSLAELCVVLEACGRSADWATLDAKVPELSPSMQTVSNYIASL